MPAAEFLYHCQLEPKRVWVLKAGLTFWMEFWTYNLCQLTGHHTLPGCDNTISLVFILL